MVFPELETNRLKLVQVSPVHAKSYYNIMSRDDVTKYYGMDSLKTIEEAEHVISSMQNTFDTKRGIRWAILLKDDDTFIGTLGLNNLSFSGKKAEIGYELHPTYWNKGITTEAVKEVLRYSFNEIKLFRMGAVTYPQNEASIHLLEQLGFKKEGELRGYLYQNQQNHDAFIFSLLRREWQED